MSNSTANGIKTEEPKMIKGFKFYKGLDNFQLKIMHDDPKKDYFCIYSSFEKMMKQVKFLKEHGKIEITD